MMRTMRGNSREVWLRRVDSDVLSEDVICKLGLLEGPRGVSVRVNIPSNLFPLLPRICQNAQGEKEQHSRPWGSCPCTENSPYTGTFLAFPRFRALPTHSRIREKNREGHIHGGGRNGQRGALSSQSLSSSSFKGPCFKNLRVGGWDGLGSLLQSRTTHVSLHQPSPFTLGNLLTFSHLTCVFSITK